NTRVVAIRRRRERGDRLRPHLGCERREHALLLSRRAAYEPAGGQGFGAHAPLSGAEEVPGGALLLPECIAAGAELGLLVAPLHLEPAQRHHLWAIPDLAQRLRPHVANDLVAGEVGAARGDAPIPVDRQALPEPVARMILVAIGLRLDDAVLLHHAGPAMGPDGIPFVDRQAGEELLHVRRHARPG